MIFPYFFQYRYLPARKSTLGHKHKLTW